MAERQEMYYRIQEIFNEDSPLILLYYKPYLVAAKPKFETSNNPRPGSGFGERPGWTQ